MLEGIIGLLNKYFDIIIILGLYASSIYVKVVYLYDGIKYIYLVIDADPYGHIILNCYFVIVVVCYIFFL